MKDVVTKLQASRSGFRVMSYQNIGSIPFIAIGEGPRLFMNFLGEARDLEELQKAMHVFTLHR